MTPNGRVNWLSRRFKGQHCWPIVAFLALALLTGCGAGGADGYYSDTPNTAQSQPKTVPLPTAVPTLPPPSTEQADSVPTMASGSVMAGDDYAISVAVSFGGCVLSPFAFFLFAYAIGGPILRRYGLLPARGTPNE